MKRITQNRYRTKEEAKRNEGICAEVQEDFPSSKSLNFVKAHYLTNAFTEREELEVIYNALTHSGNVTGCKAYCIEIVVMALKLYDAKRKGYR